VIGSNVEPQVDFSGGQINESAKRRNDLPVLKTASLQQVNFRTEAQ